MEDGGEGAAVQFVVADIQLLEVRGKVGHELLQRECAVLVEAVVVKPQDPQPFQRLPRSGVWGETRATAIRLNAFWRPCPRHHITIHPRHLRHLHSILLHTGSVRAERGSKSIYALPYAISPKIKDLQASLAQEGGGRRFQSLGPYVIVRQVQYN
jgi:hypothetical protein